MKKNVTAAQMISQATAKISGDISLLQAKADRALGVFRQAASDLEAVNSDLMVAIDEMDNLTEFIASRRSVATETIEDNKKICGKIYDIIGE